MSTAGQDEPRQALEGRRVALVGKLAGMPKREAHELVRRHGGTAAVRVDESVDLVVVGEYYLPPLDLSDADDVLDDAARAAAQEGRLEVITETQLWQKLGLVECEQNIHRLYTPAMLADLLGVPVSAVRRWHRLGLIRPAREVKKLPYFDFQEVATARRLAELVAAGVSPEAIQKKLDALGRLLPGVERPLAQLSILVEGKQLLLRQGDGLIEPGGQLRFDFEAESEPLAAVVAAQPKAPDVRRPPEAVPGATPEELAGMAADMEDQGYLEEAAETYRAALAAGGPDPEICFQLAELLYRLGDLPAARERYFMAIEIDEEYVEARSNLGCVLEELGSLELAAAAFEGALSRHPDYPDAHYHLARTLDDLGRHAEAEPHWQAFLELAPDSPWADVATHRLNLDAHE